jgi:hypothetical protein
MWYIRATMFVFNNNLQKNSFKNSFVWKSEKKLKKNSQSFHKVISTTPLNNLHMHYNMEGASKCLCPSCTLWIPHELVVVILRLQENCNM